MNRLSEYITGMKVTRQFLKEAKLKTLKNFSSDPNAQALRYVICAFESYIAAQNCVMSIKSGKKPKGGK